MPSSAYTLLRGADAPDFTGDAPGAFLGHSHRTIEEVYLVLDGEITVKLGNDVLTLVPPATPRAARNDTDGQAAFLMMSVKVADHRAESQGHEGFWT